MIDHFGIKIFAGGADRADMIEQIFISLIIHSC